MRRLMFMANARLREGKLMEFETWLADNGESLQTHAPPGWRRGHYTYELGLGGAFNVVEFWECGDKWADIDVWMDHEDETWEGLKEEHATFFEGDAEAFLLKALVDSDAVAPSA